MSVAGKHILLGVCGGIAAYKSLFLTRLLIKEGAEVKVVMTPEALDFVGALSFSALSKNPVATTFFNKDDGTWNNHIELAAWADLMIVAPATANTISNMANGACSNLLLAVYLSAKCPVIIFPAMDTDMWEHPSTQKNIEQLKSYGNKIISPETGALASGMSGEGRLPEPEHILNELASFFSTEKKTFSGKKILITAGPTIEKIDAVRFISNHSSGKMGFALADAFCEAGADVTLIHGPVSISTSHIEIKQMPVISAEEMYAACDHLFSSCDLFISAAAVADFTPENPEENKIKKSESNKQGMTLSLRRTADILAQMGARKNKDQVVVGFALETDHEIENATHKLQSKNLDFIVLNSMRDAGAGFNSDTNKITILDKYNNIATFELKSKREAARDIVNYLYEKSRH